MSRRWTVALVAVWCVILAAQAPAMAGPPEGAHGPGGPVMAGAPPEGGPGRPGAPRREAEEKIKALRVYQLTEILALDPARSQDFFSRLARYDEQMNTLRRERHQAMRGLRSASVAQTPLTPAEYQKVINTCLDVERREAELHSAFIKELGAVLTPAEITRFMAYEVEFERRLKRVFISSRPGASAVEQERALEDLRATGDMFKAPGGGAPPTDDGP